MRLPQRITVVDCGAGHVAAALFVVAAQRRLVLERFSWAAFDGRQTETWASQAGQTLAGLSGEAKLRGRCRMAVPAHLALVKRLKVLAVAKAKQAQVIRFEAAQRLPHELTQVAWDWAEISRSGAELELFLAAAKNEDMQALCAPATAGGLRPCLMEPSGWALKRAYAYNYAGDAQNVLIAEVGEYATQVLQVDGDRFWVRTLGLAGSTMTHAVAEELAIGPGEAALLRRRCAAGSRDAETNSPEWVAVDRAQREFSRRLEKEIMRSMAVGAQQAGLTRPACILLTGDEANLQGLGAALTEGLKLPVSDYAALRNVVVADGALAANSGPWMQSLPFLVGLAAGGLTIEREELNLLPEALQKAAKSRRSRPWYLAALLLLLIALELPTRYYQQQRDAAQTEAERIDRELAVWRRLAADNAASLTKLSQIAREIRGIDGLLASKASWPGFFAELQQCLLEVEDAWLDRLRLQPNEGGRGPTGDQTAPLRLELSGRLLDLQHPLAKVSPDALAKAKLLMARFAGITRVAALENPRFDHSQPGILRFECTLVMRDRDSGSTTQS